MNQMRLPNGLSRLSWYQCDPEQRLHFRGGRFTRVNNFCSFVMAIIFSGLFYAALFPLQGFYFAETFTQRGFVPYAIVFFFFWSIAILMLKSGKLSLQRKALRLPILPENPEFVLSSATVAEVTRLIHQAVDDPQQFILLNRIEIALANLKNLGRVADLDEILRSQGEQDESTVETSYSIISGFVWAIPVLGFIGTVEGLSRSIGGFGQVLSSTEQLSEIKTSLQHVTSGLSIAFETTLQGLLAALIVQLLLMQIKKREEEFLDDCAEFCVRNVVGRLRVTPYEMMASE